jgi:hypothetical protein
MPLYKHRTQPVEARRYVWGDHSTRDIIGWSGALIHHTSALEWDEQQEAYYCSECVSHFFTRQQANNALVVPRIGGDQLCYPGDWIVRENRVYSVYDDITFKERFEESA